MRSAWVGLVPFILACAQPERPVVPVRPAPEPVKPTPTVVAAPPPASVQLFAPAPTVPTFVDPDRRAKLTAAFPAIEKAIEQERFAQNVRGLVVGVVIDGELAYSNGFGAVSWESDVAPDADTLYRIGAITKTFTSLALLSLRDDGVLGLDDPLTRWIPDADKLVYPTSDEPPITLRQLADHVSGLAYTGPFDSHHGPDEAAVIGALAHITLDHAPGLEHEISNLGFALLGIAVSRAAKQPLHDVVESRILRPLGMFKTSWKPATAPAPSYVSGTDGPVPPEELGALDGASGMYSSVRELARYAAFVLAAYPPRDGDDRGPIKRSTVREAQLSGLAMTPFVQPVADAKPGAFSVELSASSDGFGWQRRQTCSATDRVGSFGIEDSHRAALVLRTSAGVGVIVLSNYSNVDTDLFAKRTLDILEATGAMKSREAPPAVSAEYASVMTAWLDVYNAFDAKQLAAILGRSIHDREQEELASYKALHGACTKLEQTAILAPRKVRYAVTCERGGQFEVVATFNGSGKMIGFSGRSPDIAPSDKVRKMFSTVLGLMFEPTWNAALFKQLVPDQHMSADGMKALAARIRAQFGTCKPSAIVPEGLGWSVDLTCTKGPPMRLMISLDRNGNLDRTGFSQREGTQAVRCPTK